MNLEGSTTSVTWHSGRTKVYLGRIEQWSTGWRAYRSKTGDIRAPRNDHGYEPGIAGPSYAQAVEIAVTWRCPQETGELVLETWPLEEWDERNAGHADFRAPKVRLALGTGENRIDQLVVEGKAVERFRREDRTDTIGRYVSALQMHG